jgi:Flp pilus assembly protein TadD
VADHRNFRILPQREEARGSETEQLDRFLSAIDPGLLSSLRQDEQRRKRLLLAAAALTLGLVIGGCGVWLVLRPWTLAPSVPVEESAADQAARNLVSEGQKLMRVKEFEKAWTDLRLATELSPNLVEAWDSLGFSYFYGGQTADAERVMRRCLEIDPGYNRARIFLGDISFHLGDWAAAKKYWSSAPARERALARLALLENRFDDAVPSIKTLIREVPDDRYVMVMEKVLRAGKVTPELRVLLEPTYLVSRTPETAQGWRLYYLQRYGEAMTAFDLARRKAPRDGSATIGRGWSLLKLGRAREAQSEFQTALRSWPSNYSALNGMAWSLKAQGMPEGAIKHWQRVLELPHRPHIEIPESLKGLGMIYFERGDYARANPYFARSALLNPYDTETAALLESTLQKISPP